MKKIIFILFALQVGFSGFELGAQTLSFSQVKLVSSVETVPQNKVWKVENILPSVRPTTTNFSGQSAVDFTLLVNGLAVFYLSTESRGNLNGNGQTGITAVSAGIGDSPIWLPSGTTLAAGNNIHGISVLEFNVLP
ncbi:MAG: hypothetical protein O3C32_00790 [Bacteroidetes bacterium]|nr:hypothetical protein [Bacteroidota bacterium]